ncbi:MAG: Stp1/IreP family PP2C-type Ser/Thr phosphatase [Firmicutes bacterium]|nr:Stp1/IreP family PP2C-type Ser/Thr phosphatase [Bacillota bacterium]MBQ9708249.1 Stp1/IreP family PP2C-type Ser/Thr phosphatase [Bacillota bacterium]
MTQIGFKCDRGVSRANNEDACFVIPSDDVYIVADGVGGNSSGEVASRTAVSEIAMTVNDRDMKELKTANDIFEFFGEAIESANEKIYMMGRKERAYRGMATTVVAAYVRKGTIYIANVGDSRAYLLRDDKLSQITRDHTYVNELVEKGVITEEEAETHSQRNVITRALGADITVTPDFYQFRVSRGDIVMLCSDGLYGEIPDEDIMAILSQDRPMSEICQMLVDEANAQGGRDNITVVCLKI